MNKKEIIKRIKKRNFHLCKPYLDEKVIRREKFIKDLNGEDFISVEFLSEKIRIKRHLKNNGNLTIRIKDLTKNGLYSWTRVPYKLKKSRKNTRSISMLKASGGNLIHNNMN